MDPQRLAEIVSILEHCLGQLANVVDLPNGSPETRRLVSAFDTAYAHLYTAHDIAAGMLAALPLCDPTNDLNNPRKDA